jgi:CBS-domain-containing membrane protein
MSTLRLSDAHATPARPLRPTAALHGVKLTDTAVNVMTDFACEHPITISEGRCIADALEDMIRFGVRALLVMRDDRVSGLITSYDIQGERPLKFLQSSTYTRHDEVQVCHIMTPWDELPLLDWEDVRQARVADVLEVFRASAATHLVVLQMDPEEAWLVRGLLSRTRLDRQLAAAR